MSNKINGVNTEVLNTILSTMSEQPEMAKATFLVKSEWIGGIRVKSGCKIFALGVTLFKGQVNGI